ncbi:MAG: bifunctional diaminohydroxyphosphoribosylaminopyrimidine deaminase/5-amino-6-(5-phosphoribosylamino)uracil reductase RibD [Gemmatimonadota bacterium]
MAIDLPEPDREYLERALALGRLGWGHVRANPMVGCVLVRRGSIVGEGHHEVFGGPHAEIVALERARGAARGATAYVSLEPCNHHGKTPPCTLALREAGVRKVVYGAADPGETSGGGGDSLRAAGIEVLGPVFPAARARAENPAFFHNKERGRTFVALKLAVTLDGRISERPGARTQISGPEAQEEGQRLRAGFGAVMVGGRTAVTDDPLLTVRGPIQPTTPPVRIVVDAEAELSARAALFRDVKHAPVLVFVADDAPDERTAPLERAGAVVHRVRPTVEGIDLEAVLDACWERRIHSLFCEGGGRLATSLLNAGLVGRLYLLLAPSALGPAGVAGFPGPFTGDAWRGWRPVETRPLGRDVLVAFDREP